MIKNILDLMLKKKLPPFNIVMILYNLVCEDEKDKQCDTDIESNITLYLNDLKPVNVLKTEMFEEDGSMRLRITRESILEWIGDITD